MIKKSLILICITISTFSCNKKSTTVSDSGAESKLSENRAKPIAVSDGVSNENIDLNPDACLVKAKVISVDDAIVEVEIQEVMICRTVDKEPKDGETYKMTRDGYEFIASHDYILELSFPVERRSNKITLIKVHLK